MTDLINDYTVRNTAGTQLYAATTSLPHAAGMARRHAVDHRGATAIVKDQNGAEVYSATRDGRVLRITNGPNATDLPVEHA